MKAEELFFGTENVQFLLEVVLRTTMMFLFLILVMKFTGKRSIRQLSIFEMVMIIALGSAAGDPMFYKEVGIAVAATVLVVTILIYRIIIYLVTHSEKIELYFEGKPEYLIRNGQFTKEFLHEKKLGVDEFFSELRMQNIEHIGQVKDVLLETNGTLSIIFRERELTEHGLPIWPEKYLDTVNDILPDQYYSCMTCGKTVLGTDIANSVCSCKEKKFVRAIATKRIS